MTHNGIAAIKNEDINRENFIEYLDEELVPVDRAGVQRFSSSIILPRNDSRKTF